jgi:hypothetical protein
MKVQVRRHLYDNERGLIKGKEEYNKVFEIGSKRKVTQVSPHRYRSHPRNQSRIGNLGSETTRISAGLGIIHYFVPRVRRVLPRLIASVGRSEELDNGVRLLILSDGAGVITAMGKVPKRDQSHRG